MNFDQLQSDGSDRIKEDTGNSSEGDLIGLFIQFFIAFAVSVACVSAFELLRRRTGSIYHPKTKFIRGYKVAPPPRGLFAWIFPLLKQKDEDMSDLIGADAAFWLIALRSFTLYFAFTSAITLVMILPTNYYGGLGLRELDGLTIANIDSGDSKLWVHLVVMDFIIIAGCTLIIHLHRQYVILRARHLFTGLRDFEKDKSSRTVLVNDIPKRLQSEDKLRDYFEKLNLGEVESVNLNRNIDRLVEKWAEREKYLWSLELAYVQLYKKLQKTGIQYAEEKVETLARNPNAVSYLKFDDVPHQKKGGKKLNSLDLLTTKLELTDYHLMRKRQDFDEECEPTCTAFVTFKNPRAALLASQVVLYVDPLQLICKQAPEPRDVIWSNLGFRYSWKTVRGIAVTIASFLLIIFWFIPLSLVLSLISLSALSNIIPGLEDFVGNSAFWKSLITNVLPTYLTSVLMGLLPNILYAFTSFEKPETHLVLERRTMSRYFFFLVVNVFIFVTLGSTFLQSIQTIIREPATAIRILGVALPASSSFFINYVVLYLSAPAVALLQIPKLIFDILLKRIFATTPRSRAGYFQPTPPLYYVTIPLTMLLFTISLCYTVISPLINIFACFVFAFTYISTKYLSVYVYVPSVEGGADIWPSILDMIFTSFILFQVTMVGVFALKEAVIQASFIIPLIYVVYRVWLYCKRVIAHSGHYLPLDQVDHALDQNSPDTNETFGLLGGDVPKEEEEDVKCYYFNKPVPSQYRNPVLTDELQKVWLPKELAKWKDVQFNWSLVGSAGGASRDLEGEESAENLV